MRKHRIFTTWAGTGAAALLTVTFVFALIAPFGTAVYAESTTQQLQDLSAAFRDVAKKVSPAVVYISTEQTVTGRQMPGGEMFDDDFFRRFFGVPDNEEREYRQQGLGSGFLVREDGYILTNNHVVEDADKIKVTLPDKREFTAELVGTDPKSDVAVIKIDGKNFPVATLGESAGIEVGDWAIAIGTPYGLSQTVTAGIISAKGRGSVGIVPYEDFIQTDAAINPGNSGGPLVNIHGDVIGLNTAIFSRSGGYQGIGFAIPINMAKRIMESLITKGRVVRGWLGVVIQDVSQDIAKGFGLDDARGALIGDVMPDGPAEQGGIERGDIIVAFDGTEIADINALKNVVAQTEVDKRVDVIVIRGGKEKTLTVTVGEQDADKVAGVESSAKSSQKSGLTVQELTPEIADQLGFEDEQGVIISDVERNSPAGVAGLRRGDLVKEVNRTPITSLKEYNNVMKSVEEDEGFLLLIKRGDNTFYVVVNVE